MTIPLAMSTHTLVSTGAILLVAGSILAIAVAATDAEWFLPVSVAMVGAGTSLTMIPTLEEDHSVLTVSWQIVAAIAVVAVLAFFLDRRRRSAATRSLGNLDAEKKNDDDHCEQEGPEALSDLCKRSHCRTMDGARPHRPLFRLLAAFAAGAALTCLFVTRGRQH